MNVDIDITGVILKTNRLILREWTSADLSDFYEYASVDGVGQMAGWLPHEDKEKSAQILSHFIEEKKTFAIEYNGKVIGSLGIEKYDEKALCEFADLRARELGFVLSKNYWGLGLMAEAINCVIDYLFNEIKLDLIVCGHFKRNNQSKRVQEKCGFTYYKDYNYTTRYNTIEDACINVLYNKKPL